MRDLIWDIIDFCVWRFDVGKISVIDKIWIENTTKEKMVMEKFVNEFNLGLNFTEWCKKGALISSTR